MGLPAGLARAHPRQNCEGPGALRTEPDPLHHEVQTNQCRPRGSPCSSHRPRLVGGCPRHRCRPGGLSAHHRCCIDPPPPARHTGWSGKWPGGLTPRDTRTLGNSQWACVSGCGPLGTPVTEVIHVRLEKTSPNLVEQVCPFGEQAVESPAGGAVPPQSEGDGLHAGGHVLPARRDGGRRPGDGRRRTQKPRGSEMPRGGAARARVLTAHLEHDRVFSGRI